MKIKPFWYSIWISGLVGFLLACQSGPILLEARYDSAGEPRVSITTPGLIEISVARLAGHNPWNGISFTAVGDQPVRRIRCWGMDKDDLLEPGIGNAEQTRFTAFDLLPRESFVITDLRLENAASRMSNQNGTVGLRGFFLWELPANPDALQGAFRRASGLDWSTSHGLMLGLGGKPSELEFECSAPLPHISASIAWDLLPNHVQPIIWFSSDAKAWVKLPDRQLRNSWENALNLTEIVRGHDRFFLRLVFQAGQSSNSPVILRRLRIEREVAGVGRINSWKTGINKIRVSLAKGSGPLEIRWLGST